MTRRTRSIISSVSATLVAVVGFIAYAACQVGHVAIPNACLKWREQKAAETGTPAKASPPNPIAPVP